MQTSSTPATPLTASQPQHHGWRLVRDSALGILVGFLSVVQSRINGQLAIEMDSGINAAVISFGTGLALIAVVVLALPRPRAGFFSVLRGLRRGLLPKWLIIGGLGGATFVASQGAVVPTTGVALFTVAIVAGLTANSLLADRLGVGPGGRRPVTATRVIAAVLAVAGVLVAVAGKIGTGSFAALLLLLAFVAGGTVAFQQGLNARVGVAAQSALAAGLFNFIMGFSALVIVAALVQTQQPGLPLSPPSIAQQPILWTGGLIGVTFVVVAASAVRGLGVLLFSLLTIVGQLAGGVAVDLINPIPGAGSLPWSTWAAVGLAIVAALLAFLGSRSRPGTIPG